MSKFKPDYSHRTDYTPEYPFNSVTFPSGAPVLGEDLNELQDIQNYKRDSFNAAMYTDGYIHTSHIYVIPNTADNKLYIDGYVLISGELYRIKFSIDLDDYDLDSLYIYAVVTTDKEYTESSKIRGLTNYLSANDFGEEVSRREGYSISATITKTPTEFPGQKSLLLMRFSNGELAYMTPAPTPKNLSQDDALLDMRVGKTFKCYDADIKSFEYHFEDNGTFYYVVDNGAPKNNVELYRSNDLVDWERCSLHEDAAKKHFEVSFSDAVNGHVFLFTTDGYMYVSVDKGNIWEKCLIESNDTAFGAGLFQSKVVPVGDVDANVICVTPDRYNNLLAYKIKLVYFDTNTGKWASERLPYEAIPNRMDQELPRIGNYVVTPAGDVCIAINGLRFHYSAYCYSFVLAFVCGSKRLVYDKMIVASADETDYQKFYVGNKGKCPDLQINVAGDYSGCPNANRCISYAASYPVYSEHAGLKIWCLDNAGSTITLNDDDCPDDLRLNLYSSAYTVRSGSRSTYNLVLANDFYFLLDNSCYSVDVWNSENCDFQYSSFLRGFVESAALEVNEYGLLPIYSDFYNGSLWLWKGGYGYVFDKDTRLYNYIRALPGTDGAKNVLPGENISFLTDKKGQVYAMWRNNDVALPKYYISSLSRDLVWSESREIAVNKCEELKPYYADHAIYFENDGDIYISGEIK